MIRICRYLIILFLIFIFTSAIAWGQLSLGFGGKLQNDLAFTVISLQSAHSVVELGWSAADGKIIEPGLSLSTFTALYSALIQLRIPLPIPTSPFVVLGGLSTNTLVSGYLQGHAVNFQLMQEGIQAGAGLSYTDAPISVYGGVLYTFLPLKPMTLENNGTLHTLTIPVPGTPQWGWNLGMRYTFSLDALLERFSIL